MKIHSPASRVVAVIGTGACLWASALAAADQASVPAEESSSSQGGTLETIVVTAERRAENVQKVPIPISAFSEQMVETMRIENAPDLAQFVPGLSIPRANVTAVPFLRGIGNLSANPGNEPAVATYVDDVYYPSPAGSVYGYNNIARIEVLKGPQGTLFGRNAAGGVINIATVDPSPSQQAFDFGAGYGNYDSFSTNLYASTGLGENLAADISASYQDQDEGWGKNLVTGRPVYLGRQVSVRSKWIYTPSDDWKFRFIADYDHTRDDVSSVLGIAPGTTNLFGYGHTGGFYDMASNTLARGMNRQFGFSLRADHDFGWATGASISSWRRAYARGQGDNTDASVLSQYRYDIIGREDDWTQELQLASSPDSRVKWIAGLFYFHDKAGEDPLAAFGYGQSARPGSASFFDSVQTTDSYSAYTQATSPVFSDKTRLTLGLRYTYDERDIEATYFELGGRVYNEIPKHGDSWGKTTYRVALDHDLSENALAYASYNLGFKSGYFPTGNPTNPAVGPEELRAYEIGFKSDLLNRTLRVNASVFYYDFRDIQVQQIVTIEGRTTAAVVNAAGSEHKGVDLDVTYQPTSRLTLIGSFAALDAEFTDFQNAAFTFPCVSPTIAGCTGSVNGGGFYRVTSDATGYRPQFAEKFTGTVTASYRIPATFGALTLTGSTSYHSGYFFDVQNSLEQPEYTLINASIMWTSPRAAYDVTVWGSNLTDEKYLAQFQRSSTVSTYSAQAPLMYGVKMVYHFAQ